MKTAARSLSLWLFMLVIAAPAVCSPAQELDAKIDGIVRAIGPDIVALRRDIHAHPELSLQETRTAALVAEKFRALGLEVREGIGGRGVLGVLRGAKPGRVVGFRGDMDALPVTEETGLPFASTVRVAHDGRETGVMHACGHDCHTAMLVGVATVLSRLREEIAGTVLFIAQPAEEVGEGARRMLEDGLFRDVKPDAVFAYHVADFAPAGVVVYVPGHVTANVDEFSLAIFSEGCHGAKPHLCVDPVFVGAQVVVALQAMIARRIEASDDTVVTVGSFHAGTASNIVPQRADLQATVRTYGEDERRSVREKIEQTVEGVCRANGARCELDYSFGIPSGYNDPALTERAAAVAGRLLGKENVVRGQAGMVGEDFGHFGSVAPSALLWLGAQPEGGTATLHAPTFSPDEAAIPVGLRVMAAVLLDALGR
ncbi:MAG: amidohydrolase [Candidatus Aminicenantes bacterium]|nr:amidohydrolase [Candidatus Aminicenantes bacterium]